jgi:hypothetical protein
MPHVVDIVPIGRAHPAVGIRRARPERVRQNAGKRAIRTAGVMPRRHADFSQRRHRRPRTRLLEPALLPAEIEIAVLRHLARAQHKRHAHAELHVLKELRARPAIAMRRVLQTWFEQRRVVTVRVRPSAPPAL